MSAKAPFIWVAGDRRQRHSNLPCCACITRLAVIVTVPHQEARCNLMGQLVISGEEEREPIFKINLWVVQQTCSFATTSRPRIWGGWSVLSGVAVGEWPPEAAGGH